MNKEINFSLISSIKNNVPKGKNPVNVLMDILHLGREAVYRRLRGEVTFNFEEVVKISRELNISLDDIVDSDSEHIVFSLGASPTMDFLKGYIGILESYISTFTTMNEASSSQIRLIINKLPYLFYMTYEAITRFRLYRNIYQLTDNYTVPFSEFTIMPEIRNLRKQLIVAYESIPKVQVILDRNVFKSFIVEMEYFYKLKLISDKEIQQLKDELLDLIFDWERLAKDGVNHLGNEVIIYLSSIYFESSYIHFESDNQELANTNLYSMNVLSSQNSFICTHHKKWIESMKRFSTQITQSGEVERIEFFNEQKEMIVSAG